MGGLFTDLGCMYDPASLSGSAIVAQLRQGRGVRHGVRATPAAG
jgi:hypothetical protein